MTKAFFFIVFISFSVIGQKIEIKSDRCLNDGYPFLYSLPNDSILLHNPPILIFLHGKSLSGNNLNLVRKYGVIDAIERGRTVPSIVLAPQVPMGSSWNPRKILNTMNYLFDKYPFDTNRVYITGMSLGGYGTVNFAATYPEKITAGVALCGGYSKGEICNLSKTNMWIQHGVLDRRISHSNSEKIFNQVISCDSNSTCYFTSYSDANHSDLAHEFYKDTIYNWMFQFNRLSESKTAVTGKKELANYVHANIGSKKVHQSYVSSSKTSNNKKYHTVKNGESLYKISNIYGVSVDQIKRMNNLSSDIIYPNQILTIFKD
jgi:pimeloyl-ACP methyl ester carboxylesterase